MQKDVKPGTDLNEIAVEFFRSPRARRLALRVRADGTIRVTLPRRASIRDGRKFILEKQRWIIRQLRLQAARQQTCREWLAQIPACGPTEARNRITRRLEELAARHGFTYGRVTFRTQKSRWGSCSARNNLSLNLKLALLPERLLDLVLLHELVHTEIKNHGPAFHARLEEVLPGARRLDRELDSYAPILRMPFPENF